MFSWAKSSISGLFNSKANNTTTLSQVDAQVDVDGTIMLLDLLVRKITGEKYVSSADKPISLLEARGCALSIMQEFEKVAKQAASKSGISATNLNFNPVPAQSTIVGQIRNGNFSKISKTLYSFAKEACPDFKQKSKFADQLKFSLEEILPKKMVLFSSSKKQEPKIYNHKAGKNVQSTSPSVSLNDISKPERISDTSRMYI